jgi:uncharacterized protein (UPF0261 family)
VTVVGATPARSVERTVVIVGSLDTKGRETAFVRDCLVAAGVRPYVVDFGILGEPQFTPDVSAAEVATAAGSSVAQLRATRNEPGARGRAIDVMAAGAARIVRDLWDAGHCAGVIGLGGGQGSTVISAAMRELPVGIPKVLVSTMSPDNVGLYFGAKDLCLIYSVTDIAGLNRVLRRILANAANAIAGMVTGAAPSAVDDRRLVAISMFGTTTRGVMRVQERLESAGYETIVFHAVGSGGRGMEEMIDAGLIDGVVDYTPSEITDELLGGIFTAGPTRLEAAGRRGIPQVVVPGALGQLTMGPEASVPTRFRGPDRQLVVHNPSVTVIRANAAECAEIGRVVAAKLSTARGPVAVAFPRGGNSEYEAPGGPLYDAAADDALFDAIEQGLPARIRLVDRREDINDPVFADIVADTFIALDAAR